METKNRVRAQTTTKDNYSRYKKITSKQWQVYYYLLNISFYDAQSAEDHRFVYKKDLNIAAASRFLGVSRPTIYSAITNLCQIGLMKDRGMSYSIYARDYVEINRDTLQRLISFSRATPKNIDLLRTYLYLKKLSYLAHTADEKSFTKRNLIMLLGHNTNASESYYDVQNYLALLCYLELVELKTHVATDENFGHYTVYHLQKVNETSEHPDLQSDLAAEMKGSTMPNRIYDAMKFSMPELLE